MSSHRPAWAVGPRSSISSESKAEPAIRLGQPADIEAVLALWKGAGSAPSVTDDAASLSRASERDALLVAEEHGRIVGSLIAAFDGWRGNMYRLAVAPDRRREGIALALVREGERRLAEHGCIRFAAIVLHDEPDATGFWRAAGYDRDERVVRFVKTTAEL
jgi:ribosomal protein S18 acetylase RimI-like enzyme